MSPSFFSSAMTEKFGAPSFYRHSATCGFRWAGFGTVVTWKRGTGCYIRRNPSITITANGQRVFHAIASADNCRRAASLVGIT